MSTQLVVPLQRKLAAISSAHQSSSVSSLPASPASFSSSSSSSASALNSVESETKITQAAKQVELEAQVAELIQRGEVQDRVFVEMRRQLDRLEASNTRLEASNTRLEARVTALESRNKVLSDSLDVCHRRLHDHDQRFVGIAAATQEFKGSFSEDTLQVHAALDHFSRWQVAMQEKIPLPPDGDSKCAHCHRQLRTWLCSRCQAVRYCSMLCQKAAWPQHKSVCVPH
jgi:septal ring factor EnvC (AmiA/AmiB activator)